MKSPLKRILLLMASHTYRAGAFLDAARALGVDVVVGSDRTQALAFANPLGHLTLDFARDEVSARVIADFARRRPLDAIVASDDDGAVLAARAAELLDLPHASAAAVRTARDKGAWRERLAAAGVAGPWFTRADAGDDPAALASRVPFPCVVKPTALSASRGVIRADEPSAFVAAFQRAAAIAIAAGNEALDSAGRRSLLVESYVPGAEVALEGVLRRGALRVLAVFDKPDPLEGPLFEETIYLTPSRMTAAAHAAVVETTLAAAQAIGLDHGPVHAELRWDGSRAVPVEIAPRSIGGLCSRALRFDAGASLEQVLLRHALGESLAGVEREASASGVMMIPIPAGGTLVAIRGRDAALGVAGIEDIRITIPVGDRVVPLPEGGRYLGFIFARADAPAAVEEALRTAHRLLEFDIDTGGVAGCRGTRHDGHGSRFPPRPAGISEDA